MSRSGSHRPRPDAPSTDAVRATPAARRSAPPTGAGPDRRAADGPGSFFGRHRRIVTVVLAAIVAAGFVYYRRPADRGARPDAEAPAQGPHRRLALGVGLEAFSMFGDIVMFRGVFAARGTPIGWRRTADIRMAGAAATKLLAAAGTGGIALTVCTLRGWRLTAASVAGGLACYMLLTYAVYLLAVASAGFGLWLGLFSGPAPIGLTLIPDERRYRGDTHRPVNAVSRRAGRATPPAACGALDGAGGRQMVPRRHTATDDPLGAARRAWHGEASRPVAFSAQSRTGGSTSERCGRASRPLATRRRGRCW